MRLSARNNLKAGLSLYRTWETAEYAAAMAAGRFWITTLKHCREVEGDVRQDAGEGSLLYHSGIATVSGDGDDPILRTVARRSGIAIKGDGSTVRNVHITNSTNFTVLPNAYVFCMSRRRADKFGDYCVRVDEPQELFRVLTICMTNRFKLLGWWLDAVKYRDRFYSGLEPDPPHQGFIKPTRFSDELETRFLWMVGDPNITPFLLDCPHGRRYCTNVSE